MQHLSLPLQFIEKAIYIFITTNSNSPMIFKNWLTNIWDISLMLSLKTICVVSIIMCSLTQCGKIRIIHAYFYKNVLYENLQLMKIAKEVCPKYMVILNFEDFIFFPISLTSNSRSVSLLISENVTFTRVHSISIANATDTLAVEFTIFLFNIIDNKGPNIVE